MSRKTRIFIALGVVMVWACFTGFYLNRGGNHFSTLKQLPDGSWLQFGEASFTNGAHTFSVKAVTGWREKISNVLPKAWTLRLGWLPIGGGITVGGAGLGANLTFSTIRTGTPLRDVRVAICDEMGNCFAAGREMGEMSSSNGKESLRIQVWVTPAFPRRGKMLKLRLYEFQPSQPDQMQLLTEFSIPNPAQGHYPNWKPETIPATNTDGDLSATLLSLKSGLSKVDPTKPAASNEVAVTQAILRVDQKGHDTNAWRPRTVEISDATGNHWIPYPKMTTVSSENGLDYLTFDGALWPGESAWKMRFEFFRVADFAPDEVCTFQGVTVPGAIQVITLDNTANIAGSKLQLMAISGEKAEQPGNLKWVTVKNRMNISVRVDPLPPRALLTLVKVTDESGREAQITHEPVWNATEDVFSFQPPTGAKQLSFTFALHQSRIFEFQVKPEFVHAN